MHTRSKSGIYKPKHPLSLLASHDSLLFPPPYLSLNHLIILKLLIIMIHVCQKAIAEEYEALVKQGTWVLVPPPSHGHIIGCQ